MEREKYFIDQFQFLGSFEKCRKEKKELTSKIYFFPNNSSRVHPVNKQNSVPTKQISPVRRQTTVGVPEKLISLLSSTNVRWKVLSTNVCDEEKEERAGEGQ